jgi:hypothetical protein
MIGVNYGVLNQKGSPSWFSDIYANIPTAGYKGRMFISIDTYAFYRDTGTGWDLIGGPGTGTITGSGTSGQVSYFNGSSTLAGSNNLFWDNTNGRLGIGTATPGAPLDIHSTGTNAQFNGTGTNNAYLVFQNAGTSKWRIGNTYNAGANSFDIYNNGLTTNAISIENSSNDITLTGNMNNGVKVITTGGLVSNTILVVKNTGSVTGTNGFSSFSGNAANNGFTFAPNNSSYHRFITPTTGNYDYTFPATTGTIALTSDLSSYLPLTGGTLTGALVINPTNTLTIGLDVASNTTRFRSDNLEGNKRQLEIVMGSGTLVQLTAKGYLANYGTDMAFYTATTGGVNASPGIYITGTNNRVGIKTGTPSYDLDVSGDLRSTTSAYFGTTSGNIGLGTTTIDTSGGLYTCLTIDSATYQRFSLQSSGVAKGRFQFDATNVSLGSMATGGKLQLFTSSASNMEFLTNDTLRMIIRSDGNVGINTGGLSNFRLYVKGVDTTSSNNAFLAANNADSTLLYLRNDGYTNTGLAANSPYNYNVTFSPRTAGLDASGGFGYIVSTKESKGNIKTINNIDYINQLNPVSFNYRKKNNDNTEFINELFDDVYYGFIADEVEQINKDLVFYDILPDGTKKLAGVHYNSVIAILTKSIQDLNEKLKRNNIN